MVSTKNRWTPCRKLEEPGRCVGQTLTLLQPQLELFGTDRHLVKERLTTRPCSTDEVSIAVRDSSKIEHPLQRRMINLGEPMILISYQLPNFICILVDLNRAIEASSYVARPPDA